MRRLPVGQAVGHPTALEPMTEVAIRPPVSVLAGEPRIPLRRPEARWRRWRVPVWPEGAVVGALVVLAAALRLPNLGRAYWVDEGISVGVASHHLTQIPGLLRHDGSPPFFYVILHFWLRAFGGSQISTHILSLLISLVVVVVASSSVWSQSRVAGSGASTWMTKELSLRRRCSSADAASRDRYARLFPSGAHS